MQMDPIFKLQFLLEQFTKTVDYISKFKPELITPYVSSIKSAIRLQVRREISRYMTFNLNIQITNQQIRNVQILIEEMLLVAYIVFRYQLKKLKHLYLIFLRIRKFLIGLIGFHQKLVLRKLRKVCYLRKLKNMRISSE